MAIENEWARSDTQYMPRSRADKTKLLPGGVYNFVATMAGWYLDRTGDNFEFPFKIYSASDHVINRISTYWTVNGGNLGVLMNGLRGAGKTMTAQLLANKLITERNLPVLVVRDPVPLQLIFTEVKQDLMVIFDEFEKTHNKEHQQSLLSTIDGMSRSSHNRLIIFTTNVTTIDENFKDRPSRIHYQFEFMRVADEVIDGLIEDGLPEDLKHFKGEIIDFLNSRSICTIDIVKAVIAEVRTFREPPRQFEDMLNIAKGEPPAYTIQVLNPQTNEVMNTACHYFKLESNYARYASLLSGNKKALQDFSDKGASIELHSRTYEGPHSVILLEKAPEDGCWLAQVAVPRSKTFYKEYEGIIGDNDDRLFLDARPKDWSFPFTPEMVKHDGHGGKKYKEFMQIYDEAVSRGTLYGTGKRQIFKIRIDANRITTAPTKWKVSSFYDS